MKYSLVFAPKKIHFRKRRSRFMSASEFIRICSLSTNLSVDCTVCQIENNNIQLAAPIWHDWVRECLTKKNAFLLDFVQMIFGLLTWHDRPSPLASLQSWLCIQTAMLCQNSVWMKLINFPFQLNISKRMASKMANFFLLPDLILETTNITSWHGNCWLSF